LRAIALRRDAEESPEDVREMALIVEAAIESDVGNRAIRAAQRFTRSIDPQRAGELADGATVVRAPAGFTIILPRVAENEWRPTRSSKPPRNTIVTFAASWPCGGSRSPAACRVSVAMNPSPDQRCSVRPKVIGDMERV
jgi:hypothetical protein